jgi:hypothetical protein
MAARPMRYLFPFIPRPFVAELFIPRHTLISHDREKLV